MSLITLILTLIFIGIIMWLINSLLPMDPLIKRIINIVIIIAVIIWLLRIFGVWGEISSVKI